MVGKDQSTTVIQEMRLLNKLKPLFLASPQPTEGWWSSISQSDIERLYPTCRLSASLFRFTQHCAMHGYLQEHIAAAPLDAGHHERHRKGETTRPQREQRRNQFQPLPDQLVGECGRRVCWMTKVLAKPLLDLFEAILDETQYEGNSRRVADSRSRGRAYHVIANWRWSAPDGDAINALPFDLSFTSLRESAWHDRKVSNTYRPFQWPPATSWDILRLMYYLQAAHAWLILLMSGVRSSTIMSFNDDCLAAAPTGFRILGRVYKTSALAGKPRDWPAPPLLVQAVEQQIRLSKLVKRLARPHNPGELGPHLWVQVDKRAGMSTANLSASLQRLAEVFSLSHLLSPDHPRISTHRFRKTLARVIGLTMTNAQTIAMDCFGHEEPEVTLAYLISDKRILADVRRVQRELVLLLAKDAIRDGDTLGGRAGLRVRAMRNRFLRIHNKTTLDPVDIDELAEMLTMGGRDWMVVIPGVICTIPGPTRGPCATGPRPRDPGNCQSGCEHQVLTAYNKAECDDMVADILEHLQKAIEDDAVTIAMWVSQLRNWLYRWRDVHDRWASHPLVMRYGDPKMSRGAIPS